MKTPIRSMHAVLFLAGSVFSAHAALTTSVTSGSFSEMAGAITTDFGVSPVNNFGTVSGPLPSGYTGGGLFNFGPTSTLPNGISARPPGSEGNFWSIGTNSYQAGPGIVTLATPASYFGFLWGSPDAYNTVSFYDGSNLLGSFDGSAIKVPPNGDQTYAKFFNVFAGQGEQITRVVFTSTTNAFETDNHAIVSAVPEPETYAMLLAGLGLLGWHARRRQRKE